MALDKDLEFVKFRICAAATAPLLTASAFAQDHRG